MRGLLTAAALFAAAPAFSQGLELAFFGGYTTPGALEHDARTVEDLTLQGSVTWGVSVGYGFAPRLGVEASWARQESGLELTSGGVSAEMFDMTVDQIQGSLVYLLGGADARVRPFLSAGAGAAIFGATDIASESKLAFNFGAGLRWLPSSRLGVRLSARYSPTYLNDAGSDVCDPFGFCQGWLHQVELTAGLVLRFGRP
jgi:opacity protein-like surface antigen